MSAVGVADRCTYVANKRAMILAIVASAVRYSAKPSPFYAIFNSIVAVTAHYI